MVMVRECDDYWSVQLSTGRESQQFGGIGHPDEPVYPTERAVVTVAIARTAKKH